MSEPIVINTDQMNGTISIMLPMPTIIIQIPSIRMISPSEVSNGQHNGSNVPCIHCGYPQTEEQDTKDDIKEVVKEEEIDEDIKEEEMDEGEIKEEYEEGEVKEEYEGQIKEEISEEEMNFQHQFNEYILHNDMNLYESALSPASKVSVKDEVYDWENIFMENDLEKYTYINALIAFLKQGTTN